MYICIVYIPSLLRFLRVFQESVQTNLLKSSRNPQVTTEASVEVLRKFPLVPAQGSNPEKTSCLESRVYLPPEPPVLFRIFYFLRILSAEKVISIKDSYFSLNENDEMSFSSLPGTQSRKVSTLRFHFVLSSPSCFAKYGSFRH